MDTRVEPTPLLLDGDKHAEITSTGVFRFIYDGGQLCLNRYDLAELLRLACGDDLNQANKALTWVSQRGHRFTDIPWVQLPMIFDEEPF